MKIMTTTLSAHFMSVIQSTYGGNSSPEGSLKPTLKLHAQQRGTLRQTKSLSVFDQ